MQHSGQKKVRAWPQPDSDCDAAGQGTCLLLAKDGGGWPGIWCLVQKPQCLLPLFVPAALVSARTPGTLRLAGLGKGTMM
jgi:hypothetical protein